MTLLVSLASYILVSLHLPTFHASHIFTITVLPHSIISLGNLRNHLSSLHYALLHSAKDKWTIFEPKNGFKSTKIASFSWFPLSYPGPRRVSLANEHEVKRWSWRREPLAIHVRFLECADLIASCVEVTYAVFTRDTFTWGKCISQ